MFILRSIITRYQYARYEYMYKIAAAARRRLLSFQGKFELFSRYLAMGDTWRPATPSSCSPTPTLPTLPRAAAAVLKPGLKGVCVFLGFHALSQARHTCFFTVPCGIITSLDLAIHNCIYLMRVSGACRDFFS